MFSGTPGIGPHAEFDRAAGIPNQLRSTIRD